MSHINEPEQIEKNISLLIENQFPAFVYIWEDSKTRKFYIGSHKGTLNDGYVASSETFIEEYEKRPKDFKRVIVSMCETYEQAIEQEAMLCKAVNAKMSEIYYNQHNGDGKFYNKKHTEETKKKLSLIAKGTPSHLRKPLPKIMKKKGPKPGYKQSKEHIDKRKMCGESNPMFGKSGSSNPAYGKTYTKGRKWYTDGSKDYFIYPKDKTETLLLGRTNGPKRNNKTGRFL